jgi:hypothetical protein
VNSNAHVNIYGTPLITNSITHLAPSYHQTNPTSDHFLTPSIPANTAASIASIVTLASEANKDDLIH